MHPRVLALALSLLGVASHVCSATGGPDAFGYVWCDSDEPGVDTTIPAFNATDLRGLGFVGDDAIIQLALPVATFPGGFVYYGVSYQSFWLSSNGWLSFVDPQANAHPFPTALPSATTPNATVGFYWEDLTLDGIVPLGLAGPSVDNDAWVISLRLSPPTKPAEIAHLYVILRNDMTIKVIYTGRAALMTAASGATEIGIEDHTGTIGLEYMNASAAAGGALFRADYAVLFGVGLDCDSAECTINQVPPTLGNTLRAARAGADAAFAWPGAPSTEISAHRLYKDADPTLPEITRSSVADRAVGIEMATDVDALASLPNPIAFYQLVGLSCDGDLIGPY